MKKFMISALLLTAIGGSALLGVGSNVVKASTLFQTSSNTKLAGSDSWNRGIKAGTGAGQGLYMVYSYYYNASNAHTAGVYTKQHGAVKSYLCDAGQTATKNSLSVPNYTNAYAEAAVHTGNRSYVRDSGNGAY